MHKPYIRTRKFKHHTGGQSYTPVALRQIYGFPPSLDGSGKTLALIELGGGFVQADLDDYFKGLGLTVKPVKFVSIGGAQNSPGDPNGADGEVMLDLCVAGGCAPGVQLVIYMADNSNEGFVGAIEQAVKDGVDAISISWGSPEDQWDAPSLTAMNAAFMDAVAAGITVTVAAGDNGSSDGERGNHADFPASSPYVTGCGGTSLVARGTTVMSETVWNDGTQGGATGGGLSVLFPLPSWQANVNMPGKRMRGVPDVSAVADPETGYVVIVDGQMGVVGGTSAVAPLWAALACCLNQGLGKRVGFLNPTLYALKQGFRDITQGNNGTYTARAGFDLCTGLGVPIGTQLLAALGGQAAPIQPPPTLPPPNVPAPLPAPGTGLTIVIPQAGTYQLVTAGDPPPVPQ